MNLPVIFSMCLNVLVSGRWVAAELQLIENEFTHFFTLRGHRSSSFLKTFQQLGKLTIRNSKWSLGNSFQIQYNNSADLLTREESEAYV